jgi:hypothetical protein
MPIDASPPEWSAEGSDEHGTADSFIRAVAEAPYETTAETPPPLCLQAGDLVSDRFVIERLAGSGGMGAVYRAMDRVTGTPVALKVMSRPGRHDDRFAQEARVLATLQHPAIVSYVAHGVLPQGQRYLAMQWLEGEDLAQRLSREGLSVTESLAVAHRLAEGLAAAHARWMVHRDVKPSNVLLVDKDPRRAMLLDFGIVHMRLAGVALTAAPRTGTGMVLGTVGYMSPEQAIADRQLDARTDVFALGCVLFECLTGQAAFAGEHIAAVLAKVLREESPRVRELRPELPAALDELVARLLAKDRAGRPPDAAAVLRELEAIGDVAGGVPETQVRSSGLSADEQRLVSVILAAVPDEPERVGEIVRRHGGDPARLANGALLVTLASRDSPSAKVVTAAACALALREAFHSARIALATGRAQATAGGPTGMVIDQAAMLLARSRLPGIRIDTVTAGLLGERFDMRADGEGRELLGRNNDAEPPRHLLGKPTPCVGRDKELGLLELTLRECVDESVARAVLVTAPPGRGKSRLRHEFVSKARERGDVAILMARADPVGAGSTFMMVRQLVRQAVGLRDGDPANEQHARLRAYVADVCREGDFRRIADFLGELIRVPSTDRPSPELRAARNDAQIMAVWLGRSFGEWFAAECARKPLLVVLEDLHWGDLPSVMYLREALRTLANKPLMVLGLARPEVHEAFPDLWGSAEKNEVALGRLVPRAAERLVRAALGDEVAQDTVAGIVERADGNAFFLEELIRRVAEGGGETLPETVLALVQSRLEQLEPEARRIVRAASVFGEVFWTGAVAALLGTTNPADLGAWLEDLARRELVSFAPSRRYPGEREYVFRHGLVREAAYAMLTEADRTTGHRLAGDWLERMGENDALMMADHFEKGGEPRRAVPWLVQAAQAGMSAVGRVALKEAIAHLRKGLALTAQLPVSVERDRLELSVREPLNAAWTGLHGWAAPEVGENAMAIHRLAESLGNAQSLLLARWWLWTSTITQGRIADSLRWVERLLADAEGSNDVDLKMFGHATAMVQHFLRGELLASRKEAERAGALFDPRLAERWIELAGHQLGTFVEVYDCQLTWMLGFPDQAQKASEVCLAHARADGHAFGLVWALTFSSYVFAYRREPARFLEHLDQADLLAREQGLEFISEVSVPQARGIAELQSGRPNEAIVHLRRGIESWTTQGGHVRVPYVKAALAEAVALEGDPDAALDLIDECVAQIEQPWSQERLWLAEVLRLKGWILGLEGREAEAEAELRASITCARKQQAKSWELRSATTLARLLSKSQRRQEAHGLLASVYGWFTEGQDTTDLIEAKALLDELSADS